MLRCPWKTIKDKTVGCVALKALGDNAQSSLHEAGKRYLHTEAQLVAERDDVSKFASDIQRLRIDLQRLQTRIAKLA